jgi:hypothetical protein
LGHEFSPLITSLNFNPGPTYFIGSLAQAGTTGIKTVNCVSRHDFQILQRVAVPAYLEEVVGQKQPVPDVLWASGISLIVYHPHNRGPVLVS